MNEPTRSSSNETGADEIRVTRPDGITDEAWTELKASLNRSIEQRGESDPEELQSAEWRIDRPHWGHAATDDGTWEDLKKAISQAIEATVREEAGTPPLDFCGRSWCVITGEDHREFHAGDAVNLVGDVHDGTEKAWWGWLTQKDDDDLIDLVVEGHFEPGFGVLDFTIPVWQVNVMRAIIEDDRGVDILWDLMVQAGGGEGAGS